MVKAVIINGGNNKTSRLTGIHQFIESNMAHVQVATESIYVHELPSKDLLTANFESEEIIQANQVVAKADIIFVLTPIYKASFTGILKTYLDVLPQKALEGKKIVPIALGGSIGHLLAIEYTLKPVLSVLGATEILNTVYIIDQQIERLENNKYKIADEAISRIKKEFQNLHIHEVVHIS
ncbi:SsuE family FMN reductase [Psychrobacillus insolitus]|uniref:SsuE family FMN reductase n=1 Tax=Psychrobacillus insolitus TaxID=1461 RepID=A0A2W7MJ19_9BACI|nr:NADPH-dependent FMN reductase [Psychrobacillus insolitus]PZX07035.1 SsuE family FMN reductase [Psychrobacillus insolitus]